MARQKVRWTGHLSGRPEPGERIGRIVLPVELENGHQGREVNINIPVSKIPTLVRQLQKAYDTGLSLREWKQA